MNEALRKHAAWILEQDDLRIREHLRRLRDLNVELWPTKRLIRALLAVTGEKEK